MTPTDSLDVIWIVERFSDEDYGSSKHVISWHRDLAEAEEMAARLGAEFERASMLVWPWYEAVETIWAMLNEQEYILYGTPSGDFLKREAEEHEAALIEQLTNWWHQELRGWQCFVEDEVMPKMADPPRFCRELVSPDKKVRYVCLVVGRDPAVTRVGYTARAERENCRESFAAVVIPSGTTPPSTASGSS